MTRFNEQSKLLELLSEGATVKAACQKVGMDRKNYYRWHKDNLDFRLKADKAIILGKHNIRDVAFSTVVKEAHNGNLKAAIFVLQHYDPDFRPMRTTSVDQINHRHTLRPGEICRACGYLEPEIPEYKKDKNHHMTVEELSSELFKRVRSVDTRKKSEAEMKKIIDDFIETNKVRMEIAFVDASDPEDEIDPELLIRRPS